MKHILLSLLFIFVGIPLVLMLMLPLIIGVSAMTFFGSMASVETSDRRKITTAFSSRDIEFGGNEKALLENMKRLRSLSANPSSGTVSHKTLSVAVVTLTKDRLTKSGRMALFAPDARRQPIEIDLTNSGDAAVLLIANRPVVWSTIGTSLAQRAKIGIDGPAVFDIQNAHPELLAGFRIAAFGAHEAIDPRDADPSAAVPSRVRFCKSVAVWAKHFRVDLRDIRFWRFEDPDRIAMQGEQLSQIGGLEKKREVLTDFCRRYG